jgi:hypothetical protein
LERKITHQSTNFFEAIEELHHVPLEVKFQTKDIIRKLEQQIRLKKNEIQKEKEGIKEAANTLAESFE